MKQEKPVNLPDIVYSVVRGGAPPGNWVRLLVAQDRNREPSGYGLSTMPQTILWNNGELERGTELAIDDLDYLDHVQDYFRDVFDVAHWRRVVIGCDIDGRDFAVVTTDPDAATGPLDFWNDSFWNHLEAHRTELETLARRHYAT